MEMENLGAKSVGRDWRTLVIPIAPCVSGIVESICIGDEVGAAVRILVVVKSEEAFVWEKFLPCVAFVGGLPHCTVDSADEYCLDIYICFGIRKQYIKVLTVESLK